VELLIVLVVIGIAVTLGFPSLSAAVHDARLAAATGAVVDALEYARLNAMMSGRGTQVVVDYKLNSFEVRQFEFGGAVFGSGWQLSAPAVESGSYEIMQHPGKKGLPYKVYLAQQSIFQGVGIVHARFVTNNVASFDSLGRPSAGGSVILAIGDSQAVVNLEPLTGRVTANDS